MPMDMGLYDRDYMRWTERERRRYVAGRGGSNRTVHPAVVLAALVALGASVGIAKVGFGLRLHGSPGRPSISTPVACVGPSSVPCPPGSVRVRDPRDPNNPNEWPNDAQTQPPAPRV